MLKKKTERTKKKRRKVLPLLLMKQGELQERKETRLTLRQMLMQVCPGGVINFDHRV
jgi:hypothetical protein